MKYPFATMTVLTGLILIGLVSTVHAEPNYYDVVRSSNGQIVHSSNGNCVRTMWLTDRDHCAPPVVRQERVVQTVQQKTVQQPQATRKAAELTREERTVYFQFDRFTLLPKAKERLDTLSTTLKSDQSVKEARIVGYADRLGSDSYNERLSQRRAEAVLNYLIANGYTNARVAQTRWVGESEPSTNCPSGARSTLIACLQNDRRVEVEIDLISE